MHIVIATYNGWPYTQRLLQSLGSVQGIDLHVVIVDNGSTDGTPEILGSLTQPDERGQPVPSVARGMTLVANGRNMGASAAWNLGIRIALLNGADKILVVGNDTMPMPGTIERLAALLDAGVPFVTGTAVPYDKPEVYCPLAQPHETLLNAPDFSFFMFTPALVEMVARWDESLEFTVIQQCQGNRPVELCKPWDWGLFDERYALAYCEDNDYHLRIQRAGLRALRDPGAEFRHETSLTIRTHPQIAQANPVARNLELFKAKWGGLPHEVEVFPGSQQYPVSARPSNVTDEQWVALAGGHPVAELPREEVVAQAKATYAQHGVAG